MQCTITAPVQCRLGNGTIRGQRWNYIAYTIDIIITKYYDK